MNPLIQNTTLQNGNFFRLSHSNSIHVLTNDTIAYITKASAAALISPRNSGVSFRHGSLQISLHLYYDSKRFLFLLLSGPRDEAHAMTDMAGGKGRKMDDCMIDTAQKQQTHRDCTSQTSCIRIPFGQSPHTAGHPSAPVSNIRNDLRFSAVPYYY